MSKPNTVEQLGSVILKLNKFLDNESKSQRGTGQSITKHELESLGYLQAFLAIANKYKRLTTAEKIHFQNQLGVSLGGKTVLDDLVAKFDTLQPRDNSVTLDIKTKRNLEALIEFSKRYNYESEPTALERAAAAELPTSPRSRP